MQMTLPQSQKICPSRPERKEKEKLDEVDLAQMSLFDTVKDDDILEELKNVDLSNMTPIDALNKLYELQNKIKTAGKEQFLMERKGVSENAGNHVTESGDNR